MIEMFAVSGKTQAFFKQLGKRWISTLVSSRLCYTLQALKVYLFRHSKFQHQNGSEKSFLLFNFIHYPTTNSHV